MKTQLTYWMGLLLLMTTCGLTSCETTRDVAVTSFKVLDAPANYIRHQIDEGDQTTTTTVSTTTSTSADSDYQRRGQPIAAASSSRSVAEHTATESSAGPETVRPERGTKTRQVVPEKTRTRLHPAATPKPNVAAEPDNLPYGKPVPGKPGYVYSPYDPSGGYVDVTGFSSGSKVKDPYSNRIFLVP